MHSLLAVDEKGSILTPLLTWADNRSFKEAQELNQFPESMEIYKATGTPQHSMSPLTKIRWIQKNQPGIAEKAYKYISACEYIFHQLTGKYYISESLASTTGLFNIHNFHWEPTSLRFAGITENKLSEVIPGTEGVDLSPYWLEKFNLSGNVPVFPGGADGCYANIGAFATDSKVPAITLGTSGAIRTISSVPLLPENKSLFCYVLDRDQYIAGGAINNGGILFDWFADTFCLNNTASASKYDNLDLLLKTVPPGSQGLLCLPYLLGERAPVWDPLAKGVFFGVSIQHRKEHFLKALVEGMLMNLEEVGREISSVNGNFRKIMAGGGAMRSEALLQAMADIFNTPIHASRFYDHSSRGAFIVAVEALGKKVPEFEDPEMVYHPVTENVKVYEKILPLFRSLYQKHKEDFLKLNDLNL
jgi:gluconokinase